MISIRVDMAVRTSAKTHAGKIGRISLLMPEVSEDCGEKGFSN
jgi:hypothetical protein